MNISRHRIRKYPAGGIGCSAACGAIGIGRGGRSWTCTEGWTAHALNSKTSANIADFFIVDFRNGQRCGGLLFGLRQVLGDASRHRFRFCLIAGGLVGIPQRLHGRPALADTMRMQMRPADCSTRQQRDSEV